jgi:hypothetical protein
MTELHSTLTCPHCGHGETETSQPMPASSSMTAKTVGQCYARGRAIAVYSVPMRTRPVRRFSKLVLLAARLSLVVPGNL